MLLVNVRLPLANKSFHIRHFRYGSPTTVRPRVVGSLFTGMERDRDDVQLVPPPTLTADYLGCFWRMGMRGFNSANQAQWPKCWSSVHIIVKELAPIVTSLCIVGQPLEGSNSAMSLRQCSGGLHCELRVQQGPSGDAPHAESLFHYRS